MAAAGDTSTRADLGEFSAAAGLNIDEISDVRVTQAKPDFFSGGNDPSLGAPAATTGGTAAGVAGEAPFAGVFAGGTGDLRTAASECNTNGGTTTCNDGSRACKRTSSLRGCLGQGLPLICCNSQVSDDRRDDDLFRTGEGHRRYQSDDLSARALLTSQARAASWDLRREGSAPSAKKIVTRTICQRAGSTPRFCNDGVNQAELRGNQEDRIGTGFSMTFIRG